MPRILLIDDDPETGASVQAMLKWLGHEVIWAKGGQEGLDAVMAGLHPDLLLTDIYMPGVNGLDVLTEIRKHHKGLPLIAMTGQTDGPYLLAAKVLGAKATLKKPFRLLELDKAVQSCLESARA